MANISLQHIKKIYPGNVEVINDLNLEIYDKEFIILVARRAAANPRRSA